MAKSNPKETTASEKNIPVERSCGQESALARLLAKNKWMQLLEIAIVFSPVLIVLISFRLLNQKNPMLLIAAIWIANIAMLVLIALGIRLRGESWATIGLQFKRTNFATVGWAVLKSVSILLCAVGAFIFGSILMANIVGIPEGADLTKYNYMQGNLPMLLISLAGAYVVASFGEEVVYRGFLITRLEQLFGIGTMFSVIAAVVISSIVFGFAHFEWGAMGIGQTTCMGLALAISFLWTKRNLWPLVLAHGVMDTLLFVQLYLAPESAN